VLAGDPVPPQKGAEPPPQFSAQVYCGQTVGGIKMPLGMETANRSVQVFLHSLRHKVPILYNGRPYPPEVPFPTGDLDLPWAKGRTSSIGFARSRIQPRASSRVLYCGHSTQYSHLVYIYIYSTKPFFTKVITRVGYVFANTVFATQSNM